MKQIAIIGNGISGVSAARHIRKQSDHKITLISAESKHFFSRTALMYVYMGHMKYEHIKPYEDSFWEKNRIELKQAFVEKVDSSNKQLLLQGGEKFPYDELIIAAGSKPMYYNWPGQDLKGVQGLYSLQDLQSMEENSAKLEHALIVGGGLIGVEMAEMFLSRGIKVTMLVRDSHFWGSVLPKEEGQLVNKEVRKHGVDLRLQTELQEIKGDETGRVKSIITTAGEEIACQFVGITTGVTPNIDFLKDSAIECRRGVLVDSYLQTNIADVYAIGDCAEFHQHPTGRRNIEQVWYTGKMMGETVAQTICGNKTAYQPGVWFNSAKFFDLEYQTYGWVFPKLQEGEAQFYWEDQNASRGLKFIYQKHTKAFLGVNAFGIRLRHKVIEQWIREAKPMDEVIAKLEEANFDPEFYKSFSREVAAAFNQSKLKEA